MLFITGAFVSHYCWNEWAAFFESNGYKTVAPPWPKKDADPATLRSRQPDKAVASLRLTELVDHFAAIAGQLPEKPILIGHSMGGLVTQILVNRGVAAAGIAIHSVPPQGVLPLELTFFKANTKALGFFTPVDESYMMSFKGWQYAFTNGLPLEAQKAAYDAIAIPESKRLVRDGLTSAAHVDFKKEHAPLLIVSGNKDQCIPWTLNRRNFRKYNTPGSVTEFVVREGRTHFVLGLPTWKEDAGFILDWIRKH